MIIKKINAKTILSKSKVRDYTINAYVGCEHGCTYCYARFMKRYTGHREPWGEFVDAKINSPELLEHEIKSKPTGNVWISGVCDPYQPIESKYMLTRKVLEILRKHQWPITIQTKSPLVLRDIDLLEGFKELEVIMTVTTSDDTVRKIFEPNAPPIEERLEAIEKLCLLGIRTYAMIAPILPKAESLATKLTDKVDYVIIDKMNYHYADWVYKKHNLQNGMSDEFFDRHKADLVDSLNKNGFSCQILF